MPYITRLLFIISLIIYQYNKIHLEENIIYEDFILDKAYHLLKNIPYSLPPLKV